MKKRIISIMMLVCFVLCFVVPVSAAQTLYDYNGIIAPSYTTIDVYENYPYAVVVNNKVYLSDSPLKMSYNESAGTWGIENSSHGQYVRYILSDGEWVFEKDCTSTKQTYTYNPVLWTNHEISVYKAGSQTILETLLASVEKIAGVDFEDWKDYYSSLTNQITVKNVVDVVAVGASIVGGTVFMWWGVRKLTRALITAFKKGKVSM